MVLWVWVISITTVFLTYLQFLLKEPGLILKIQNKSCLTEEPGKFIRSIPHMSFVWGEKNVDFLRKRYDALTSNPLFEKMAFSTDPSKLKDWMPLVMEGRDTKDPVAATFMSLGTDVNFGTLTRCMFNHLKKQEGVTLYFNHEVRRLKQKDDKKWQIVIRDLESGKKKKVSTDFVFIGAGGGSLKLLEKAGIPEGEGYGGFPVSGQWLRCTNREVIEKHSTKVYGTAAVGAPPMSVPHIDSRMIGGKKELLFGPFAGFTTKFLKQGSYLDLPSSITFDNIIPMLSAGFSNLPLTKYLVDQVRLSPEARLEALQEYVPTAKMDDWELEIAGQRVQVIKRNDEGRGVLEFGTEVITKDDGTLAVLLGASPGASTSASIMLNLVKKCFAKYAETPEWQHKMKEMVPSLGRSLNEDPKLLKEIRKFTSETLHLVN